MLTLGILFILILIKCYLRHRQQLKLNVRNPEDNFSKDSKCSLLGHEKTIDVRSGVTRFVLFHFKIIFVYILASRQKDKNR